MGTLWHMQASPYWEIAAGYVGAMRAEIPFTSLYSQAVSLTLDETLITIRPRSTPLKRPPQSSADTSSAYSPGDPSASPFYEQECCVLLVAWGQVVRHQACASPDRGCLAHMAPCAEECKSSGPFLEVAMLLVGLDPATEEALGEGDATQDPGWGNYGLGQANVVDGVRLIAGGIENVLQRLQLQVQAPNKSHTASNVRKLAGRA